jgi:hypothetical protein
VTYSKRLAKRDARIERRDAKIVELEQQLQQVREAIEDSASSSSKRARVEADEGGSCASKCDQQRSTHALAQALIGRLKHEGKQSFTC